ncbi:enhancer of split M1 protein-like [Teleopsis dalmanni]|uniref:enhancer of split M1 protein-like n=1 Tax=Teleopsis dalmanni TaxID=139649 RepID=UPI0018CC9589|nr:enhancer of split M1 protein-like [Teleopsis dalmanni]
MQHFKKYLFAIGLIFNVIHYIDANNDSTIDIAPEPVLTGFACFATTCPSDGKPVWSTDGVECYVDTNLCNQSIRQCLRKINNERELTPTSKESCQERCTRACARLYEPICAKRNGVERTFPNECVLENHICRTGEFYFDRTPGKCVKTEVKTQ